MNKMRIFFVVFFINVYLNVTNFCNTMPIDMLDVQQGYKRTCFIQRRRRRVPLNRLKVGCSSSSETWIYIQ